MLMQRAILVSLLLIGLSAHATAPKGIEIEFDPGISDKISVQAAWLSYAAHLAKWAMAPENAASVCLSGKPLPFESELSARSYLVIAWTKMKVNDPKAVDGYLDSLAEVARAGYMAEYVWKYHFRQGWVEPKSLQQEEFAVWQSQHVPALRPTTLSGMHPKC